MWGLFWLLAFWSKVVYTIIVNKKGYGLKVFSRNGQFSIDVPQDINQGDFRVSWSWDFVLLIEKVWQIWNCNRSWCIPNYQISVFSKTRHFLLPDFRRIRERVSGSGILGPIAWVGIIKRFIRFFKIVPHGVQGFQKILKWKKVFIKMGSLPTVITNSFRTPVVQKLENIFNHIFFFFCIGIYSFLEAWTKFTMTKRVQNKSIHANANIKAKFTFFKKYIHKWKHS